MTISLSSISKAGHLTSCNARSATTADSTVTTVPIREELPFGQVHCLVPVDINQELLGPRHIQLLKLYPRTYFLRKQQTCEKAPPCVAKCARHPSMISLWMDRLFSPLHRMFVAIKCMPDACALVGRDSVYRRTCTMYGII